MSDTIAKGLATAMIKVIHLEEKIDANDQSVIDALNKINDELTALTSRIQILEQRYLKSMSLDDDTLNKFTIVDK